MVRTAQAGFTNTVGAERIEGRNLLKAISGIGRYPEEVKPIGTMRCAPIGKP
jgi:hypothetical protein